MKKSYYIFQDWNANQKNIKGQLILIFFRVAHIATINKLLFFIMIPYLIFYRFFIEWVLCVELPYKVEIGKNFKLYHGQALVINPGVVIGDNCIIRHVTTIGNRINADGTTSKCPLIGNNVDIGANVCVIGPITIGDNVKIGAGTVITKDVPTNSTVVGNPARIISS